MIFFAPGHVVLPDAFFKYIYKTAPEKHNLISADMWLDEGMRGQGFAASKDHAATSLLRWVASRSDQSCKVFSVRGPSMFQPVCLLFGLLFGSVTA